MRYIIRRIWLSQSRRWHCSERRTASDCQGSGLTGRAGQGRQRRQTRGPAPISQAEPFNPRIVQAARQRAAFDLLVAGIAAIAVMAVAAFSARVFIDGDTNWHVAAGRWILAHASVPATDPFSFTYADKPWVAHEWLSEVLMALAWLAAGWNGVVLLIGLAAGTAFWLIARELRLWMGPVGQAIGLGLTFACLEPFLYARPHILAMPLLVFWTRALLAARRQGRAPPLMLTPLMAVWANMHASFIFGLAVVGPFALEALLAPGDRIKVVRDWGAFGLLALAFSLATPHGFTGLEFPFQVLGMKVLVNIQEWKGANFQSLDLFEGSLLITIFLGLWRGIRMPPFRLLLLVGLVHMALQHIRQEAVLAALAPLLLAEPFGHALNPARAGLRTDLPTDWRPTWQIPSRAVAAALAILAVGVVGTRLAIPLVRRDNVNVPVTAMAQVPPALLGQHVFNTYAFGGYLIFKGVKPFIDGRADMYGDAFVQEYLALDGGTEPDFDNAVRKWDIRWTILSPRDGLVRVLDKKPNWKRVYADGSAVVHELTNVPPPVEPRIPRKGDAH
jgi:hypothetical protein